MELTFENIITKTELTKSDFFGAQYDDLLNTSKSSAFNNPLIEDISELLNYILLKYEKLTPFQKDFLNKIFNAFNNIRINIDPNRLKPFNHFFNDDDELLLYRNTEKRGLINIIINPEDCAAFSFIPKDEQNRKFYFIYEGGDFEKLTYDFLS